ncbi:hypothetical protein SFUMM280S_04796 [Streptomyces fumanus]
MGERELPQGFGHFPGVQGVEPLDHGAALAAVEVDGVAELAHAGVGGDAAEEDAQRQQDHAEVHAAAGVVGVPGGVVGGAAAAVGVGVVVEVVVVVEVGVGRVVLAGVGGLVVGAGDGAHGGQQPGAVGAAVGALGADDGGFEGLGGERVVVAAVAAGGPDAGDDLGGAGVGGRVRGRVLGGPARSGPHGLQQPVGTGVVGGGPAAPDDGPAAGGRGGGGDAGGVLGGAQVPGDPRGPGPARRGPQLHAETRVVDDDLGRIARHLHHAQRGSVVDSRRAVPRGSAGCSGVHTHLTE